MKEGFAGAQVNRVGCHMVCLTIGRQTQRENMNRLCEETNSGLIGRVASR